MDMTMSSATPSRVEVVTSVQRRRRWTPEQKLEIVKQTRKLPLKVNKLKIETSISLRVRDEEVKIYGKSDCWNIG